MPAAPLDCVPLRRQHSYEMFSLMRKIAIALGVLAALASAAFASSAFLKISPGSRSDPVNPGSQVKVTGSVGKGCQVGHKRDSATIYSEGFSTKHRFAGVPSINAPLDSKGNFSVKVRTVRSYGPFIVSGRCGGHKFASTKLYMAVLY